MLSPLDGLDLNLLVTLRALLDESSVTRAAARLGTTQPSVSRALATLRTAFADPLLVRAGRGMTLTPFARALQLPLEQSLASLDRLRTVGRFDPATATRRFRLIVPDVIGVGLLPPLMDALAAAPGVSLEVHGSERHALEQLLRDEVDLTLGAATFEHPELCVSQVGQPSLGWSVVYSRRHPAYRDGMTLARWLASEHLQLIPAGRPAEPSGLDALLAKRSETRRVVAQVTYLAGVGPLLARSRLVTSLPDPAARSVAAGRGLRMAPHPLADALGPLPLRMTWHAAHQQDAGHQWMRATLRSAAEQLYQPNS